MDYEDIFFDENETFYNTTDNAYFNKHYRLYLERYAGKTVGCSRCEPHRGCNHNNGYKNARSWKKWRKYQCKWMESRDSIKCISEPEAEEYFDIFE